MGVYWPPVDQHENVIKAALRVYQPGSTPFVPYEAPEAAA
jgi:hypothetical protein